MSNVTVDQLFGRIAARHERASEAAGIAFKTIVEPGAEHVRGDHARLEQALQNLAANAVRYAPRGTSVELRARPADGRIAISVTDEGPGIPAEHVPHVFDRFYKVDVSRASRGDHAAEGSGLGLSIVKAIVARHGGDISVNSRPGRTVFEFRISGAGAGA
jgi:signal transduction histidine kinase